MMKLTIALTGVAAGFVVLCAGDGAPAPSEPDRTPPERPTAPAVAATALVVSPGRVGSLVPQVLDVSDDGQHVALRIPTARDAHSDDIARCDYPALAHGVDGIQLALVRFDEQRVQTWTVYRTPTEDDASCTSEQDATAQLTQAKEAMQALGLDPAQRTEWGAVPDDDDPVQLTIEHTSDSGYHTYTATVSNSEHAAQATHSPNPAMGGQGTLQARGTLTGPFGTLVVFEATHGPAGIWSDWMLTPPL